MLNLTVNKDACILCKFCEDICPTDAINITDADFNCDENACIKCGHCVASCPQSALDHPYCPLEKQVDIKKELLPNADAAEMFLRARRSVRNFTNKKIDRETITKLLEITRYSPHASNYSGISYLVIDDKKILKKVTAAIIDWLEIQIANDSPQKAYYIPYVQRFRETGADVILRDAPCLIVPVAHPGVLYRNADTDIALSYLDLYATSMGLGSCWIGFILQCARDNYAPLYEALQVPKNKEITGGIILGYPQYSHYRLVDRNPVKIIWVEDK